MIQIYNNYKFPSLGPKRSDERLRVGRVRTLPSSHSLRFRGESAGERAQTHRPVRAHDQHVQ